MKTVRKQNGFHYEVRKIQHEAIPRVLDEEGNEITPAVDAWEEEVETSIIRGIEPSINPDSYIIDTIPHTRTIELLSLTFENDLEMIVQARINYYSEDGTTLKVQEIEALELSEDAKSLLKQKVQPFVISPKRTRNSWVIPPSSENGYNLQMDPAFNENTLGAIPETAYYQQLTRDSLVLMGLPVAEETRDLHVTYQFIKLTLLSSVQRLAL